jgi:hypothetical protein
LLPLYKPSIDDAHASNHHDCVLRGIALNLRQPRPYIPTAVEPSQVARLGVLAASKSCTNASIDGTFDLDPANNAIIAHDDRPILCNPEPPVAEVLRTDTAAVRISVETLAAAHRVNLVHAEARAALAAQAAQADCGVGGKAR